jgi:hypothetical protein
MTSEEEDDGKSHAFGRCWELSNQGRVVWLRQRRYVVTALQQVGLLEGLADSSGGSLSSI